MTGPSFIYFVRCGDFVKIGVSKEPKRRLRSFLTGSPHQLELLACHPGTVADEARLHRMLEEHHHRGEWYRACPAVDDLIAHGIPRFDAPSNKRLHPDGITSAGDVMALWPSDAEFARDIGVKPTHGTVMKLRGSIPPDHWPQVVAAASARRIKGVTLEMLSDLRRAKFGAPQKQGAAA